MSHLFDILQAAALAQDPFLREMSMQLNMMVQLVIRDSFLVLRYLKNAGIPSAWRCRC